MLAIITVRSYVTILIFFNIKRKGTVMDRPQPMSREVQAIDAIIARHKGRQGELLGILEETQLLNEHKYLSEDALNYVAQKTGVPLSKLYSVATFYSFFNLVPQGDHTI